MQRKGSNQGRRRNTVTNRPARGSSAKRIRRKRQRKRRAAFAVIVILMIVLLLLLVSGKKKPVETPVSYPVEYEAAIRIYADRFNVPAAYVASTILAESSYNAEAVSSANAQGLMQITPETGEWIASKLKETYTEGCLLDADTNLRFGCWFLGFLVDRYGGDIATASSAYHQGYHTVDDWLQDSAYSNDGSKLKVIPSDATDNYVDKILQYYAYYQTVYE